MAKAMRLTWKTKSNHLFIVPKIPKYKKMNQNIHKLFFVPATLNTMNAIECYF